MTALRPVITARHRTPTSAGSLISPDGLPAIHRIRSHHAHFAFRRTQPFPVMAHREIHSWLMDMDGVLVHEEQAIPGADEFVSRLRALGRRFLVLTNNSIYTR